MSTTKTCLNVRYATVFKEDIVVIYARIFMFVMVAYGVCGVMYAMWLGMHLLSYAMHARITTRRTHARAMDKALAQYARTYQGEV